MAEAWRRRERQGGGFLGFGAHSLYQEAPEVIQWGSWLLCSPPSYGQVQEKLYTHTHSLQRVMGMLQILMLELFLNSKAFTFFLMQLSMKKKNIGYSHHYIYDHFITSDHLIIILATLIILFISFYYISSSLSMWNILILCFLVQLFR